LGNRSFDFARVPALGNAPALIADIAMQQLGCANFEQPAAARSIFVVLARHIALCQTSSRKKRPIENGRRHGGGT
jgi:hypothetical protein